MKWITRKNVKVDRIACPWVINRCLDKQAEFFAGRVRAPARPGHNVGHVSKRNGGRLTVDDRRLTAPKAFGAESAALAAGECLPQ
jgi:Chromate resistance exported protein